MPRPSSAPVLGLLVGLYISQGLPYGFFVQALPVILRERGMSLTQIGLASLLAMPWALKVLWAPWVDGTGTRKAWIVPLQLSMAAALLALAAVGDGSWVALLVGCGVLNALGATQDIATDGLAVDRLPAHARGWANGLQVAGYRVGMVIGGGLVLMWLATVGWRLSLAAMAVMVLLLTLPTVLSSEPPPRRDRIARPSLRAFFERPGAARWLVLLVCFKAGDAAAVAMVRPFASDAGLDLAAIGWVVGTVGFAAGLVGAIVGGAAVARMGRRRALVAFGLLQAVSVAGYAALAALRPGSTWLTAAVALEHASGGMATAALFTAMMDRCDPRRGATDYTIQASVVVVATGLASVVAGLSADRFGYVAHFAGCALLSAVAVAAVGAVRWPSPRREQLAAPRDDLAPLIAERRILDDGHRDAVAEQLA